MLIFELNTCRKGSNVLYESEFSKAICNYLFESHGEAEMVLAFHGKSTYSTTKQFLEDEEDRNQGLQWKLNKANLQK